MKKFFFLVLTAVVFAVAPTNEINAQQESGQVVVSAGAGYSLISRILSAGTNQTSLPPIYLNVDYGVTENFSIGLAGSYSSYSYDDVITTLDANGNFVEEAFSVKGTRNTIAGRALFHFGDNPNLDQYAGLRAGMTLWGYSDSGLLTDDELNANNFSFRILYGARAYITDNLAVNLEIGLGSPYLFNGGISYRL